MRAPAPPRAGPLQLQGYKTALPYAYSFGEFPTLELLTHRPEHALRVVAHTKGLGRRGVAAVRARCEARGLPFEVNDRAVERLSHKGNVYLFGVFAKYAAPLARERNHLLLVNPSDNGNVGTIVRTMLGFGVRDLALIAPAVDLFNPHVVRASMGATFAVNFAYFASLEVYRAAHAHRLYPFMLGGAKRLGEVRFEAPYTLVFGPEGAGLPEAYRAFESVQIPQSPLVESLNLAVAVGVALYEAARETSEG
ncbi:TrmH family RNA methyltransferase [Truepera radiovictrix]|uniref:TrmH family RNA methyltransferase n=1 Tax=Truepera radiovictrix TaxID=332249 RepID=UPI000307FA25|nr:TrmH family RNA methyltransferase [Truepera radiovictrix]WMT58531.1 TrmH family RNA methyltransferase [Truepera radiovictrix]